MADLGPVWETELAIHRASGAVVGEFTDHLVIRTPANPQYHWGNFVLVFDPVLAADAEKCLALFRAAVPDADWVSIGLVEQPSQPQIWQQRGLDVELLEALTGTPDGVGPLADGYDVRAFGDGDWELDVARSTAANRASKEFDPDRFAAFAAAQSQQRQELVARGLGCWFGAFADGALVADLGIVDCGQRARYQDVETDIAHRGRGLAGHLIGVAGAWAREHGCAEQVIVTESDNPAGRLYRRLGFAPVIAGAEIYRRPPLSA